MISRGLTIMLQSVNIKPIFKGFEKEEYFSACIQRAVGRCKAAALKKKVALEPVR